MGDNLDINNLSIDTGVKRITINGDPSRVIEFNPSDVSFAERFYELVRSFNSKAGEFTARSDALDKADEDEGKRFENTAERIKLMRGACSFFREQIDALFGAGTSQTAFGDAMTLDMFTQFFRGITPFITKVRSGLVAQYTTPATTKRGRPKRRTK